MAFQPSVRLRYTGLFLDGYAENGAAGNLTVSDRDIHQLQGRLQFAFPMQYLLDGKHVRFAPRFGIEVRSVIDGENVNATLLGQSIIFDPDGQDEVVSGFAGADLTVQYNPSTTFFGTFEANTDDDSYQLSGHAGARIRF